MQSACSWCISGTSGAWGKVTESGQPVWLDYEQSAASDVGNTVQFSGLTDPCRPKSPPPTGPEILFVLTTDKTFEVDTPDHVLRLHEIQSRERNSNRGYPPLPRNAGCRSPNAIPARVTIACVAFRALLLGNQRVTLRTERV